MASIISGYEYDIFISYRQQDNKGDKKAGKLFKGSSCGLSTDPYWKSCFNDFLSR